MDDLKQNIQNAKELLQTVRHAAMATVNEDNSPHNTPFFFLYNPELTKIYWGSHTDSLHSRNVLRTGQIFVVLYDSKNVKLGGLYIKAGNANVLNGDELDTALKIHNEFRAKEGKKPLEKEYYTGDSPQKMWSADITNLWVLRGDRNSNGLIIQEHRQEITANNLL
ncbi:MAG TPA: pyridoxamine 5'-phosphate oxidase family protein [Patescibacteria group bacterium]|nr:pyridoxamine 5'-phosphate oxidase family protein [Patescibacteria group bacterium]